MSLQDHDLDELILQVFEEQEDQFFYPLHSQNTARSFIKSLTTKGMSYEVLCGEIDEFEHNFSAWRKGLGRVGIGRRVIERLNRPVQEVLLSEDEDEINDILARIKDRETARPDNNRVPPLPQPAVVLTEETRILRLRQAEGVDSAPTSGSSTPSRRSPESHRPAPELQQTEPGLVDFRSVLKRRSHVPDDNKAATTENPHSLPMSSHVPSLQSNKTKNKSEKSNQNEQQKAASKPELSLNLKNKNPSNRKDVFETTNDFDQEFDGEQEFDSIGNSFETEPSCEKKAVLEKSGSQPAPLAAEEMDESLSINSSEEAYLSESSSESAPEINEPLPETARDIGTVPSGESQSGDMLEVTREDKQDYDSDLDLENPDLLRDGKRLAEERAAYKSRVGARDGPGFLYVFLNGASRLVKVGQSRLPQRRLEQALCFNTALEQVSALPVSLRQLAVQRAHTRLARFQLNGHPGWFNGPLDEIIRVVTSTAERYPHNSSQC